MVKKGSTKGNTPRKGRANTKAMAKGAKTSRAGSTPGGGTDKDREIKAMVRDGYAQIAKAGGPCCGPKAVAKRSCGCGGTGVDISRAVGYTSDDLKAIPDGADLGLGCGNPVALASLKEGETVLDLGSGAGIDCFLASKKVGPKGKVIGVDMTPEMVKKARWNADKGGHTNVEFRLGEIEHLPVEDRSVDIIISNCVINLCPDKVNAFREAFRVLRPGGRLMVSDLVLTAPLPPEVRGSISAYVGCIAGAMLRDEYLGSIRKAGFDDVVVVEETSYPIDMVGDSSIAKAMAEELGVPLEKLSEIASSVKSIKVRGLRKG